MPGADELSQIQAMAGNVGAEALGAVQFFSSLGKEKKDKQELAALHAPFYKIQNEYLQNQNIAAEQAQQGLPTDTKDYLTTESQRGLGTSLSAINAGGGSPNDIARVFSNYQSSTAATAAQDAQAHVQNIQYYMNANKDVAGQKTIQWAVNEKQPYESKLKELTERRAADETSKWGGLTTAIGSAIGAGTAGQNKGLLAMLNAKKAAAVSPDPFVAPTRADVGGGRAPRSVADISTVSGANAPQFNLPEWTGGDDEDISDLE